MKIKCKPKGYELKGDGPHTESWKEAPPFNVNPRGVLVHRVRTVKTHTYGNKIHGSVSYWCGNQTTGDGVNLVEVPPKDRLLCKYCEAKAVAEGEPTAQKLAGRHVHLGEMRAYRVCCRNEQN